MTTPTPILGVDPLRELALPAARHGVTFIAEMIGHLDVQRGLQRLSHKPGQQRTRITAAGTFAVAFSDGDLLVAEQREPADVDLGAVRRNTSMFPNGATALMTTSRGGIVACLRSISMSPNRATGDVV